ncbi:hypothetical protein [uncultured Brachyspira sp.]|uniref:hypothetical protein n=1 Tax=uncultured Brachyspira sp. TaxID=221953 RepID=UPI002611B889|nr:hypothetical protein [uncultured Brachyspira sp.]
MMKWINIVLTVLSSANMVNDIIKGSSLENKAKNMYKRLDEREKLIFERVDNKMNSYITYFSEEINSLKIVVKFLLIVSFIFFILFILSLIFFIIVLKYKKII